MKKTLIIVAGVLGVVAIGAVVFLYLKQSDALTGGTSPQGSTFGNAKVAYIAVNLANPGANGTTSSALNTDTNDRIIISEETVCENVGTSFTAYTGAGLASLTLKMATTSTSAPGTVSNTNTVGGVGQALTIATGTPQFAVASSTAVAPGNGYVGNIWAAGSYLTLFANATNTASCTMGVRYIPT